MATKEEIQNQSVIEVCTHPSIRLANRIKKCS